MNNIKNDLKNGLSIQEVCEKYSISFNELFKKLKHGQPKIKDKQGFCVSENVYQFGRRYTIQKVLGYKVIQFGSYMDLDEAITVRNELASKNWEADPMDYLGDKHIHQIYNQFRISKSKGRGKTIHFGNYHTLEDARKVRDCMVKLNWDKDYLELVLKRLGVEKIGN